MQRKPPSSLDYETLLHELALKGFRRAIRERDLGRAQSYASRLAESTDRFWRWQGRLDLATVHLLQGRASAAIGVLEQAKAIYRDVPGLQGPPDEQEACALLEMGRTRETYELARDAGEPSPFLLYLGERARRRLGDSEGTKLPPLPSPGSPFDTLLTTNDPLPVLRDAVGRLPEEERRASCPSLYLLDGLAFSLMERGEEEEALAWYRELSDGEECALAAPIPFVRALAWQAKIHGRRGDIEAARAAWKAFLSFWSDGELDADLVAEGRQFTSA